MDEGVINGVTNNGVTNQVVLDTVFSKALNLNKVSIGILGYNEEYGIARLLQSFHQQTLFQRSLPLDSTTPQTIEIQTIEIIVISNGSTDRTAEVAREQLSAFVSTCNITNVIYQVVELAEPDKCAAWNHLIHQVIDRADYYILLDADVVLVNERGLAELLQILIQHPECRLCGGKIINHRGEPIERMLDGKCYAARGDVLQQIAIPNGVVLDDAYVLITAVTDWYALSFTEGLEKGFLRQVNDTTVKYGETPRDRNMSYWIASRKRTLISEYTQHWIDYCMRHVFGGGQSAKEVSMQLFHRHPQWFLEFLNQQRYQIKFRPPSLGRSNWSKGILQYLAYCYCYLLSLKGIRDREFGPLAWKLHRRYW